MTPKIDPAILSALSLDAATTSITSHGGSGFASTFKITSTAEGNEKLFFVKQGKGKASEIMFTGEHASLNAIHNAVPSLCPKSYANGKLATGAGSFLATDFLDLSSPSASSSAAVGSGMSLAQKLAKLHSTPAPVPDGYSKPMFGFPVPTCCGETEQDNGFKESWAEFYGESRLRGVTRKAEGNQGKDGELGRLVEEVVGKVVPRLLGDGHLRGGETGGGVVPVVVHGDLWSGNHGRGSIGGGPVEEVVFDASAAWAHSEFEFGIMVMFGGFGGSFNKEYWKYKPKDEPVEEWEDRVQLYELYHHLNHYAMFGGGYRGGAVRIMQRLLKKYGNAS
ncbi:Ketosamine-3-kinase [Lachnellula arida]|uniref:protein-ribulosamine 3-kinase n=1 Tax=Lachnellula arida TaxID=1316785 RepID=A0A8T9BA70_9HELO|nr:Ketosamine-3-kinase [Lachnellula arida]